MDYILMVVVFLIVFPLVFIAATRVKLRIPVKKRRIIAFSAAGVFFVIYAVIPFITSLTALFEPMGLGFLTASLLGIILGLGGPFKFK